MSSGANYIYVAKDFQTLGNKYDEGKNLAIEHLEAVDKAARLLSKTTMFQGKTADSIKNYLQTAYPTLNGMFQAAIISAVEGFWEYMRQYTDLTGATNEYDERISTNELDLIANMLQGYATSAQAIEDDFDTRLTTLKKNNDISFSYVGPANVPGCYFYLSKMLGDLVSGIEMIEGKSGLDNLWASVDSIENYMDYLLSTTPSTFDINAHNTFLQKTDTAQVFETMIEEAQAKSERANEARQIAIAMEEKEAADKREKEAAFWGTVTDIVCGVAVVVATATLGPVGTIAVGAAAGALKSAIHEGLDQYAATGAGFGELDWSKIAIKGLVGGVTGAATSAIGVGAGALTNSLGTVTSPFLKTFGNMGVGIIQNEANVLVDHGGDYLETGLIGLYEGKNWDTAWKDAGVKFTSDLGKDMINGFTTGITSNLTGFTDGMKDGILKSGSNVLISGGAGILDYSISTALDGGEFDLKNALASGAKEGVGTAISEGFDYLKSDSLPISSWEKQSDIKAGYVTSTARGALEGYLKTSTGAYVEGLINGDKDAADSFKLLDKDGVPTSALTDSIKGGAKGGAKLYYDRNLSEKSSPKIETVKREITDENGNKQTVEVTRTTTRYETAFGGKRKVVAETYKDMNPKTGENGETVTTEKTTYYEKGKKIGTGTKTTTEYKDTRTGEKVTTVDESSNYTRKDKTAVNSTSYSETRQNETTGIGKTTSMESTTTQKNNWADHSKTVTDTEKTVTTNDKSGITETTMDKSTSTYSKGDNLKSYSEKHTEKNEFKVGEGEKAKTHTVTKEKTETITKNDIGKRTHTETEYKNTSSVENKVSKSHVYVEKGKEKRDGTFTSAKFDEKTERTYEG